jgi:hypothetical protein
MKLPQLSLRELFGLVLVAALVLPNSLSAQYADTRCEHDWTLTIGDRTFGLRQYVHVPGERRTTTVFLSETMVESQLRAAPLAAMIIIPTGILVIAVVAAFGTSRQGRK